MLLATLMSTENTCDTIRLIRGNAHFATLPIVVAGSAEDAMRRASFLTAGADGFLTKPVSQVELESVLAEIRGTPAENEQRRTA
jgi:CheY-like chemotaxis protein